MPVFNVSMKLFYNRTAKDSYDDYDYDNVPDLREKEFDDFIVKNNIDYAFIEEFEFIIPTISDITYTFDTHILSFRLTVNKGEKGFIKFKENMNEMINDIKEIFLDHTLEDTIYEGQSATYSVKDARTFYPKETNFDNKGKFDESLEEVGLIDYRNCRTLTVKHIKGT
jgi:hypothetical protein